MPIPDDNSPVSENSLLQRHPCPSNIYLPTSKYAGQARVDALKKVVTAWKDKRDFYREKLREVRKKMQGRNRCFVIGNGPSLNQTNLDFLSNEVTFATNGIFLKFGETNFRPTFLVVEDHLVGEDRGPEINKLKGFIKFAPYYLSYCIEDDGNVIYYNHQPRKSWPHGFDFSTNAEDITYTGCTVTFSCLQLAFYMGFKEIYLVGVDMSYIVPQEVKKSNDYGTEILDMDFDDPNHFIPNYFGKGYRWHDPNVDKMEQAYIEAKKITERHGVKIFNATIGGKCEVFDRVSYTTLFCDNTKYSTEASTSNSKYPRVLVVDQTLIGNNSATGALKQVIFEEWPRENILQIYEYEPDSLRIRRFSNGSESENIYEYRTIDECYKFNPDLIYFRPTEAIWLLGFVQRLTDALDVPLVIHMMDDWPKKLAWRYKSPSPSFEQKLQHLFAKAQKHFSICQAMSDEYKKRYGISFMPISNGVNIEEIPAKDWNTRCHYSHESPFTIRYMGGLAKDMTFASVCDVANVVSTLCKRIPIRFEIYTMTWFLDEARKTFSNLPGVIVNALKPAADYLSTLSSSDALLIAYNFDPESIRYIGLSLANKLPECLASGVPLIAFGPIEIATIRHLQMANIGRLITTRNLDLLSQEIEYLFNHPERCRKLGDLGRSFVKRNHNKKMVQNKMLGNLQSLIRKHREVPQEFQHAESTKSNVLTQNLFKDADNYAFLEPLRIIPGQTFWALSQTEWRHEHLEESENKAWCAIFSVKNIFPGSRYIAGVRLKSKQNIELRISLARFGKASYEEQAIYVTLSPNKEQSIVIKKRFSYPHSELKIQVDVVNLPVDSVADLIIDSLYVKDIFADIRRFAPKEAISFSEANDIFRNGDYRTALMSYLLLYKQRPYSIYSSNAIFTARKIFEDESDSIDTLLDRLIK